MSEILDRIKILCEKQGTSFYSLEKSIGLGNGTIGKWKSRKPSYENIAKVAAALGTTPDYLMTGDAKTGTPVEAPDDNALKFALFGDTAEIDDADLEDVKRYAAFVKERKLAKKNGAT